MMNQMKRNRHTSFRPLTAIVFSVPSSTSSSKLISPISGLLNCSSITIDSIVNSDDEEGR